MPASAWLFFFFAQLFLFLPPLYELGEASKNQKIFARVYVCAYRRKIYISFYIFFYFFLSKERIRKKCPLIPKFGKEIAITSEIMCLTSELMQIISERITING